MWTKAPRKKKIKLEFGPPATQAQVNSFFRKRKVAKKQPLNVSHPKSGLVDLRDEDNPKEMDRSSTLHMPVLEQLDQLAETSTVKQVSSIATQCDMAVKKDAETQTEPEEVLIQAQEEQANPTQFQQVQTRQPYRNKRSSRRRTPRNWLEVS